ncbi:MAG: hypothetical protein AAFU53_16050 [Cyanobacteria bacterium J06632_3]
MGLWSVIFALLLVDDALMLHESGSAAMASGFALPDVMGLPGDAYGKCFIYAGMGLLAFSASVIGYGCDRDPVARRAVLYLSIAIAGLVCFGGVIDVYGLVVQQLYELPTKSWQLTAITIAAEGGELVVMSATLVGLWWWVSRTARQGQLH